MGYLDIPKWLLATMSIPTASTKPKLLHVQMLRAFAAMFVVVTHSLNEIREMLAERGMNFDDKIFPGDFGVDVFFIISGFIMAYVSRDAFARPGAAREFLLRRIIRVAPLYWIMTLVVVAIVLVAPQFMDNGTRDFIHWLGSFTFIPVERPTDGLIRPLLGIGWTLQYEMFFYAIFAVALVWPIKKAIPGVIVAIVTLVLAGIILQPANVQLQFWSNPIMLEFAAGVALGWAYIRGWRLRSEYFWGLIYAGLFLVALAPEFSSDVEIWRVTFYGVPALMIVVACILTRNVEFRPVPSLLVTLGASSYALYLTHPFTLGIITMIWEWLGITAMIGFGLLPWIYTLVAMVICAIVGHGVHLLVEMPATRLLGKIRPGKRAESTDTAPATSAR